MKAKWFLEKAHKKVFEKPRSLRWVSSRRSRHAGIIRLVIPHGILLKAGTIYGHTYADAG